MGAVVEASHTLHYIHVLKTKYASFSMGWWLLRLSAKILALLRLSVNFFQLRVVYYVET